MSVSTVIVSGFVLAYHYRRKEKPIVAYSDPYDAAWRRQQEAKYAAWQKARITPTITPLHAPVWRVGRDAWCAVILLGAVAISVATLLHFI
jgi:hypothetical protein